MRRCLRRESVGISFFLPAYFNIIQLLLVTNVISLLEIIVLMIRKTRFSLEAMDKLTNFEAN